MKWKATGGSTSRIVLLIFQADTEELAESLARNYFEGDDFDLERYEDE